jgi:predicted molibdopterin-dependent oxidoreductase YjgC
MDITASNFQLTGRNHISGFGEIHNFVHQFNQDESLQQNLQAISLQKKLAEKASVCSICGVGCPFTVIKSVSGKDKIVSMSSPGLCVKGISSFTK